MKIAIVNLVSQTPPTKWRAPHVRSNHQSVGVQYAQALQMAGHEVTVFMSQDYAPDIRDEGVPCEYLPTHLRGLFSPALIPFTPSLGSRLRGGKYDVVVCSELFQWSAVFCARAKRRGRFRLYVWQEMGAHQKMAGGVISRLYHSTVGKYVVACADSFIPRANQPGEFLRSVGVPDGKIGPVVPNGADATVFCPGGTREDVPLIVCVGSLVPLKQPGLAVEAMPQILEREPRAVLLIKGFGPLEDQLRAQVNRLGIAVSVRFDTERSTHPEMADVYRRSWVGVFPTNGEGASLSPVEMVMCGTPVVVARQLYHSGVLGAKCGAEITGFDVDEIASAVLHQIGRVRDGEWDSVSMAKTATDLYSTDSMAATLVRLDRETRAVGAL